MKKRFCFYFVMMLMSSCTFWNSNCSNFSDIRVKRVYEDGVVASTCKDSFWLKSYFCENSQDVFLMKDSSTIYYDGQNIEVPYGSCPIIIGSKNKVGTTYPVITIQNPNTYSISKKESPTESIPHENIKNPKCQSFKAVQIFQVLDNFALASTCDDDYCSGIVVYVPKEKGKLYYDEQKITPPKNRCFGFNGTYQYETKDERNKTVPKIQFINATVPNPKYSGSKK